MLKNTLIKPIITEKATMLQGAKEPVYSFLVTPEATKQEVMKAIKAKYSISPLKVTMINLPRKKVSNRKKQGFRPAKRKALVFLPAGSTLNLA
ncbi:MAG: 50S ribosomal protein L23 [bacterium]|nr:50S ribosomal protein L23 [bacterium]